MSFPFRNRPNLRDRFRGKSGDEIMEEMRQSMDENRKKFLESNPKWGQSRSTASSRFPKGFPFDDDEIGDSKLLDELAQRHPELAEQLKGWGGIEKRPRHEGPSSETKEKEKPESKKEEELLDPKNNLRNTVPDMQHSQVQDEVDRAQRSQSAPPESLQRQASSPKDAPRNDHTQQNSTLPPPQQPPQNARGPTVRHIPIHVEGRDEPLLPKEATEATACPPHPQQHYQQPTRPMRKQTQKEQSIPISVQVNASQAPPHQHPQHHHQHQQHHQHPQPQQHHQQNQTSPSPPPQAQAPPPPPPRLDPLDQVALIQKEVETLKQKIDDIKPSSKKDREYIYLDEMLTRNLLKLDNIETEGREEVRLARKEAIRRIQEFINILESLPEQAQPAENTKFETTQTNN